MSEDYSHLEWISETVSLFKDNPLTDEEKKENLARSISYFSNLTVKEKRDIFVFLLGAIAEDI